MSTLAEHLDKAVTSEAVKQAGLSSAVEAARSKIVADIEDSVSDLAAPGQSAIYQAIADDRIRVLRALLASDKVKGILFDGLLLDESQGIVALLGSAAVQKRFVLQNAELRQDLLREFESWVATEKSAGRMGRAPETGPTGTEHLLGHEIARELAANRMAAASQPDGLPPPDKSHQSRPAPRKRGKGRGRGR